MKEWKLKGITEGNTCWDCGKEGLKKVAVLENNRNLEIIEVGTTCAARMLGYTVSEYKKHITEETKKNKKIALEEYLQTEEYKISHICVNECANNRFEEMERLIKSGYTRGQAMGFLSALYGSFETPAKEKKKEILKKYMVKSFR